VNSSHRRQLSRLDRPAVEKSNFRSCAKEYNHCAVANQITVFVARYHSLGSLSKARRRRERERHQTKGLMSKIIGVHKSLCISLPSSAKQQREMNKFCVVYGTWTATANFSYFRRCIFSLSTFLKPNRSRRSRISLVKYKFVFH